MRRIDVRLAAGLSVLALVAGCGGQQGGADTDDAASEVTCEVTKETRVGIATGNATGVYYVVGNALAGQLSGATGGKLTGTAAETGASVQNVEQLVGGQYDVAFSLFDTAVNAVEGKGSFTAPQPVQALARIYDNYTQVVVRNDSGITSVADMRGKRISTGSPKSGTEVIANRLLEAAGLDPAKDIRAQRLDLTKTVEGIKDGSVDGFFWSGGLPTGGLTDLFTTAGDTVTFVGLAPLLPKMAALSPATRKARSGGTCTRRRPTPRRSSYPMCCWSARTWTPTSPARSPGPCSRSATPWPRPTRQPRGSRWRGPAGPCRCLCTGAPTRH